MSSYTFLQLRLLPGLPQTRELTSNDDEQLWHDHPGAD